MFLKFSSALFLSLLASQSFAVIINANDFAADTDVSHIDSDATLTWIHADSAAPNTLDSHPVTTQDHPFKDINVLSGGTWGFNTEFINPSLNGENIASLDTLKARDSVNAMLLSYETPTNHFGFKGQNLPGGVVWSLLYDSNKQLIKIIQTGGTRLDEELWMGMERPWHFDGSYDFDFDVSYILFGASYDNIYFTEIDTGTIEVPEPNALMLFTLGFLSLTVSWKRRKSINSY